MHNKYSSISFIHSSFTLFHSFIHFKLPWMTSLSNFSNCLQGEGKTCFHSTNNNVLLLFSKDRSYEGIIFDKSFICNFILHFYKPHANVGISIQSFTCDHIPRCSVHLPIISSLMRWKSRPRGHSKSMLVEKGRTRGRGRPWKANKNEQGERGPSM